MQSPVEIAETILLTRPLIANHGTVPAQSWGMGTAAEPPAGRKEGQRCHPHPIVSGNCVQYHLANGPQPERLTIMITDRHNR